MKTKKELSSAIKLFGGGTPKTTDIEYWNGNIPWLSVVDFNTGHKYVYKTEKSITQKGLNESSTQILQEGSIIISARGTVGALAVLKKPMAFNQSCYGICGIDGISISDYIYYVLKYHLDELQQISHGGVFSTITRDTFKNIEINLPSIQEQRAIAAVLSSLDDKIDLLNRQNVTLEAMAEALFRQWFAITSGERNNKNKIGDLFDISSGKGLKKEAFLENGTYPILGANGKIGTTNEFLYDEKIIYTGRVGTLGNIFTFFEKAWYSDNTLVFTEIKYFYFTYFLLKFLHLEDYNVGSTQPLIRQSDIKNIEIFLPHKIRIEKFEGIAETIFAKIRSNQTQIRTLAKLRDTLLPRLMSGEVRVAY